MSQKEKSLSLFRQQFQKEIQAIDDIIFHNNTAHLPKTAQDVLTYMADTQSSKKIRSLLMLALNQTIEPSINPATITLAATIELMHNATLLHDDVVDEAPTRRNNPAVRMRWGNQISILMGDWLLSKALQELSSLHNSHFTSIMANAASEITQGEIIQLTNQTIKDGCKNYFNVITLKTASLFSAALEGTALATGTQDPERLKAYKQCGKHIGIAFQIADDIIDYTVDTKIMGKERGQDLMEGKMTLPAIYAYQSAQEKDEQDFWKRCIEESSDSTDLPKALELLQKHDAITRAQQEAEHHIMQAIELLSNLLPGHDISIIKSILNTVVKRTA